MSILKLLPRFCAALAALAVVVVTGINLGAQASGIPVRPENTPRRSPSPSGSGNARVVPSAQSSQVSVIARQQRVQHDQPSLQGQKAHHSQHKDRIASGLSHWWLDRPADSHGVAHQESRRPAGPVLRRAGRVDLPYRRPQAAQRSSFPAACPRGD